MGHKEDGFDFGDIKVKCACDDKKTEHKPIDNIGKDWYKKMKLPEPSSINRQQIIQQFVAKTESLLTLNETTPSSENTEEGVFVENIGRNWYIKLGAPPPPTLL